MTKSEVYAAYIDAVEILGHAMQAQHPDSSSCDIDDGSPCAILSNAICHLDRTWVKDFSEQS